MDLWPSKSRAAATRVPGRTAAEPSGETLSEAAPARQADATTPTLGEDAERQPGKELKRWQMGLVVTASALCGGIAVVLWNRRLLAALREAPASAPEQTGTFWDDNA